MCFRCGGGLKDWDPSDTPLREHAKWFGHCLYLALIKGKEYVHHVIQKNKEPAAVPSTSRYLSTYYIETVR